MDHHTERPEPAIESESSELDFFELPASSQKTYDRLTSLVKLLERYRGVQHLIILQGTPDPDAISSALALDLIARKYDIETVILSFQTVSHHENRTLLKRLEINLQRYSDEFDLSPFGVYSIVDSQRCQTGIDLKLKDAGVSFFAFVDHHREPATPPKAAFIDIRPQVASTASILCEYLQFIFSDGLSSNDAEHVRVATALMHGIRTDTNRFALATEAEYKAAAFIAGCVDLQGIEAIENRVLAPSMLDMFERALVDRQIHDNFILSDVGFLRGSDRDAIPQITELLLAREGTDTVLVWGIVDEKIIDGSLRTRSGSINPDEFLKAVLGASPESGRHYGGGNIRDKGGFQIPLGFFSMCEDAGQVYKMVSKVMEAKFLGHIGRAAHGAAGSNASLRQAVSESSGTAHTSLLKGTQPD